MQKVKRVLVAQSAPKDQQSPYYKLAEKYQITIDFIPFIKIQPVDIKDFRQQKVNILDYSATIFTSRSAVDHFFQIAEKVKINVPIDMKYFCISEQTAHYLQKYIVVRKRKIFVGKKTATDLIDIIKKHKSESYLFPCSDVRLSTIPSFLENENIDYKELVTYHTCANDLSSLDHTHYDVIALFSPSGVDSLFRNFPNFQQKETRIAAFGPTTAEAVQKADLILDIEAPMPNAPSMIGALEKYIQEVNCH